MSDKMSNDNGQTETTETTETTEARSVPRKVLALILSLGAVSDGVFSCAVEDLESLVSDRKRNSADELSGAIDRMLAEAGFGDPTVSALVCPARMILGHGLPPSAIKSASYWRSGLSAAGQYVIDTLGLVPVHKVKVQDDGSQLATVYFHRPVGAHAATLANLRKEGAAARQEAATKAAAKAAAKAVPAAPVANDEE